jgi:hypothetical protein
LKAHYAKVSPELRFVNAVDAKAFVENGLYRVIQIEID